MRTNENTMGALRACALALTMVAMIALCGAGPAAAQVTDPGGQPTPPSRAASTSSLVNLNSATAAELEALPGVGPATATRIVDYRQKNGPFKKIEDLMNVKGIGEKSFLKLKPLVTVAARGERPTN